MRSLCGVAGLQLVLGLALAEPYEPRNIEPVWADIPPSSTLEWVPCYSNAECARLEVPMDYDDLEGAKVTLAVIRIRATDTENYKGPVLFNSGGPNNSGVTWFTRWADSLHNATGRNHDIITWDPRSYSRSIPRISCWATQQRRRLWAVTSPGALMQYDDLAFLATLRHRAKIENSACVDMVGDTGILEHVSSTHTARDLHSIMEALGQEKLRYVGQSYGCLLGTYFASMFPEKVERIVCDGNIDPREVLDGRFLSEPGDSNLLLDFFMESCAADSRCAIHMPTAEAVRERFDAIVEKARLEPAFIQVGTPFDYITQLPTSGLILGVLISAVPNPYTAFPGIARALFGIEMGGQGTSESLLASEPWAGASDYLDTAFRDPNDPDAGPIEWNDKYPLSEDWTACNDMPPMPDDLEAFKEQMDQIATHGKLEASRFASHLRCMGRQFRAKGVYTGPFGGNTSHPILFTNARVDPSTPVRMAYTNSEMFSGSGLLVYENYGHSLVFDSPCVVEQIKAYFQDGTLPSADVKCADEFEIPW